MSQSFVLILKFGGFVFSRVNWLDIQLEFFVWLLYAAHINRNFKFHISFRDFDEWQIQIHDRNKQTDMLFTKNAQAFEIRNKNR